MASANQFCDSEVPFLETLSYHRCLACEVLHQNNEALIRRIADARAHVQVLKQKAFALEAEQKQLLRLLFSSKPPEP